MNTTTRPSATSCDIRWMIRRDLKQVLDNDSNAFPKSPWTEEDFLICLRRRNCISMVACNQDAVFGHMVYELHKEELRFLRFAVAPSVQQRGIGRLLVERLINKLSQQRRQRITLLVRETNTDAQLFFRTMGFNADEVVHGHYDDTDEDAYRFVYELGEQL